MTSRKPPGVSYETWVERRIREATERGAFDGLSAAGKPLDESALTQGAEGWVFDWARREGADMTAALPLSLALRAEREKLVAQVPAKPTELAVRTAVEAFNERLDAAYRRPQEVPPVALAFVDLDRQLTRWREAHPQPDPADVSEPAAEPGRTGRWWRALGRSAGRSTGRLGGRRARELRGRP